MSLCLSSPYRELPDTYNRLFIAPCRKSASQRPKKNKGVISLLLFPADRGAAANVAYAHHNSNRNVFGEWVFGCQGTSPFTAKRIKGREFSCLSALILTYRRFFNHLLQYFFQPFFGCGNTFCYGLKSTTLQSCNLLISQSLKIIEHKPPSLCFGQLGDCSM